MTAKEQLLISEQKLAYVEDKLKINYAEWIKKEYTALKLQYEAEIESLKIHIHTNKELFNQ